MAASGYLFHKRNILTKENHMLNCFLVFVLVITCLKGRFQKMERGKFSPNFTNKHLIPG